MYEPTRLILSYNKPRIVFVGFPISNNLSLCPCSFLLAFLPLILNTLGLVSVVTGGFVRTDAMENGGRPPASLG